MSHELRCFSLSRPSNGVLPASLSGTVNLSSKSVREKLKQPCGVLVPRISLRRMHSSLVIMLSVRTEKGIWLVRREILATTSSRALYRRGRCVDPTDGPTGRPTTLAASLGQNSDSSQKIPDARAARAMTAAVRSAPRNGNPVSLTGRHGEVEGSKVKGCRQMGGRSNQQRDTVLLENTLFAI